MQKNFIKLVNIINKLRGKNGCPWDQKQTLKSIRENIIEEAYETVDAINTNDYQLIKEEAGDLLLQAVFISQLAKEKNKFSIKDVIEEVTDKLIRRHPHVFGNVKVKDSEHVLQNWESIKKAEKQGHEKKSILDNIPNILPALIKANKVQSKVERFGFKWNSVKHPIKKLREEVEEFITAVKAENNKKELEEELGDILFTLVNIGRFYRVSSETALNRTIKKFSKRFNYIEQRITKDKLDLKKLKVSELERLWKQAKAAVLE